MRLDATDTAVLTALAGQVPDADIVAAVIDGVIEALAFRKVDTMSRPMANSSTRRRTRRQFDDDFKAQAVRLVLDEGKSIGAVSRDLGLTESAPTRDLEISPV